MTISLDDFSEKNDIVPTHIKIDVDGAENLVIKGAKSLLANQKVKEIFIEIDNKNKGLTEVLLSYGFNVVWEDKKTFNTDTLFARLASNEFLSLHCGYFSVLFHLICNIHQ